MRVSAMAIVIPATGVHRPKSRNMPAAAASAWSAFGVVVAVSRNGEAPK